MASKVSSTIKVVLLSCGSFNPITHMHLRLFEIARDALHDTGLFTVVGGIISPVNDAYEKKGLLKSNHRLAMCNLAVKTSDWISVSDWEVSRKDWERTADVLDYMADMCKQKYSDFIAVTPINTGTKSLLGVIFKFLCKHPTLLHINGSPSDDVTVKLVCGGDLLESFAVPNLWSDKHIRKIAGEYGIVVITRQGSNPEQFIYESDVLTELKKNIHIVTEWIPNEISATKIRVALRRNNSVKYLLPDSVIEYIKKNELYSSKS